MGIFLPCVNLGLAMIFEINIIKFNLENKWRRIYLHIGTTDRNRHSKKQKQRKLWAMADQKAWLSYEIKNYTYLTIWLWTNRNEHQEIGRIDPNCSKTLFWLSVMGLPLFHSWVVASIGDLKLLALFGVLVLKSFFRPTNIPLSLLKLGFTIPSWPEPSLSDDLKEKYAIKLA